MSDNKTFPKDISGVHIHFVGIKGTGMAALVEIFFHNGAVITGSDVSEVFYTDEILNKLGLKALPFSESNITEEIQYVIYSSAYKKDKCPDLIAAEKKHIPCFLYTEALGLYSERSYSSGICGVHGKTSTTGIAGTILKELPLASQTLAGSIINSFGGTCTSTSKLIKKQTNDSSCKNRYFIAETCEYQRHFMSFAPKKIILTSVESDHQDYYPTYSDIQNAFIDYIHKLPENGDLIYCADDSGAKETALKALETRPDINLIPYGFSAQGDFKITEEKIQNEKNTFCINLFGNKILSLSVPGHHEILDACAAVALITRLLTADGKNPLDYTENIARGLSYFSGGKRRSEIVGRFTTKEGNDVIVIDDYAHHPTAIKTTLAGYRKFYSNRKIIVDFMSHTYSRTQSLLKEFAESFDDADIIILHKIYASARENIKDFNIDGNTLYSETKKSIKENQQAVYFQEILDAKDFLLQELSKPLPPQYKDGYLFVTMGAGDNWKLGKEILK